MQCMEFVVRWTVELGSNRPCEPHSSVLVAWCLSYAILGSETTPWEDFSGMDDIQHCIGILLFDIK